MSQKTPQKTPLRKPTHGKGALKTGNPGNRGGGRHTDAFKQLCQELASGVKTVKNVKAILDNPDHGQFMAALRWATENGYGKPTERVELTGKDGDAIAVQGSLTWGGLVVPL